MKQHNSTYFRRFMNKVFNTCEESCEPVMITTRKDGRDEPQQMIVISKEQYDIMVDALNDINSDSFGLDLNVINRD